MTEPTPVESETAVEPAEPEGIEPQPAGGVSAPWADPDTARREIEKLRKEAAGHRTKVRELTPLAQRARELEEAQKTDTERLNDRLTAAEQRVVAAQTRAVRAEVKALAASSFADPDDAVGALDPAQFVSDDGEVDTAAIKTQLDELLKAKPHWARDTGPRRPAPDPAQGSSGRQRTPTSPADEFAGFLTNALGRR